MGTSSEDLASADVCYGRAVSAATQTYYEILGIREDATPDDVATARRSMLKAVHPDLAVSEDDRVERERLSRMVNDICDTLLDPVARYDYDRALARRRRWSDANTGDPVDAAEDWDDPSWPDAEPDDDAHLQGHPLVTRLPALERLEQWLTWRIAALALLMLGISTYAYDTVGGRVLDSIGLHFGRFGSLAVVLLATVLLVALCLGAARAMRSLRHRAGGR